MKRIVVFFCLLTILTSNIAQAQTNGQQETESVFVSTKKDTTNYNTHKYVDTKYTLLSNIKKSEDLKIEEDRYGIKHGQKVYDFQYYTSIIIFVVVIFIVLTGLYLSYKQFEFTHEMLRNQTDAKKAIIIQGPDATTKITDDTTSQETKADISLSGSTTFELSKDGIKINSAVIGLIILAISIAFFFLYLEYVYPVHVIK
ncbi:hypothetical protein [Mucilaginibacter sp.]|uniref:hypothetical protein n=1 Tax=Mucilaginibacter sp. TaxID=1882438 RepID=UPI0025E4C5F0|nr:hypothetical protein [Mucilaginibacter sp.]